MSTPTTPPPEAPATVPAAPASLIDTPAADAAGGPVGVSAGSRAVSITAIVVGAAVLLGGAAGAVATTLSAAMVHTETRTAPVGGVTALAVSAAATDLTIAYGDVREATLELRSATGGWTLERDGDTLAVQSPDGFASGWSWLLGGGGKATLTLPRSMAERDLDATISLSSGSLSAGGSFDRLEVDVSAGTLSIEGAARTVSASVSAGGADIELADVDDATFSLSAGDLEAVLTGGAPTRTTIDVAAGRLDLTLPDAAYDVRSDVSAGQLDTRVRTDSAAAHRIDAQVSAGSATIRPAR